jgi:hypothetical protein
MVLVRVSSVFPSPAPEFASPLLEAGGELHKEQATLGHTNFKMTSTYLNGDDEGRRGCIQKARSETTPAEPARRPLSR